MGICKIGLILFPALLFGQLSNNTVTVTASRGSNPQPDQLIFGVTVSSGIDKSLDDIVGAVAGSGITAANLAQVGDQSGSYQPGPLPPQPMLAWTFQLIVPFAKMKDTTASLTSLQKTIAQKNNGLSLSFAVQGTQVSAQSQSCDLAGLINDARAQAQKIAGPAGLSAGAIVGIGSIVASSSPVCILTVKYALGVMFGQTAPNAITITASRTSNPQADQVLILLNLSSGLTSGLDDITSALQGAGISGANFTGVNTQTIYVQNGAQGQQQSVLGWSFTLTAPISKLSAALGQILAAEQIIANQNAGLALSFYVAGTQVSPQSQPACSEADLLSDARGQAQKVAAAAGVTAGPILSVSDGGSSAAFGVSIPSFRAGDFSIASLGFVTSTVTSSLFTTPASTCTLTVQYQLQ